MNLFSKIVLCALICVILGFLSGLVTGHAIPDWYAHLRKSSLTPPRYVFPVVWTFLYILMGTSFALVWHSPTSNKKPAFSLFGIQLALNLMWSPLFFYFKVPLLGLIDITILWFFIVATVYSFYRHSKLAAYLLIPYFLWVSLAWYLNFFIWKHN